LSVAFGVAAAAAVYFGTTLDKLDLAQIATIAGLPQSPSTKNPLYDKEAALQRREHVLRRMLHYGFINETEFKTANAAPMTAAYHGTALELNAPYVAEIVRQKLFDVYGDKAYDNGFKVYTTISSQAQIAANQAVTNGLMEYDKRHGFRKPKLRFETPKELGSLDASKEVIAAWLQQLQEVPKINVLEPAVVIANLPTKSHVLLRNGTFVDVDIKYMRWAAPQLKEGKVGARPTAPKDILRPGDVIYVTKNTDNSYALSQVPEIEGSLVAINPQTGALISLVGGFDFYKSRFNRVIQAERQPGSNFKPFIYSAALENGFTAATVINDAPIVEADPTIGTGWRPQNYTHQFYGPTRLRTAIVKSMNLVTIRLLKAVGISKTVDFLKAFGFDDAALPTSLSLALGTGSVTPMELATAYCTFPNGGFKINPYLITKILDYNDKVIFEQKPTILCQDCTEVLAKNKDAHIAPQVLSPQTAYIMTSMLKDAIKFGTGRLAATTLKRGDIAGKTGTTNDHMDAWYSGFNQQIVATTWMGFDEPRSMAEYASTTTLPMWISFMQKVLADMPETEPVMPDHLLTVKIDAVSGLLAKDDDAHAVTEIFIEGSAPTEYATSGSSYLAPDNQGNAQTADESLF
jgi:penicillin-binding protein 1A